MKPLIAPSISRVGFWMDSDNWLLFLLFIALTLGGGYFAAAEISFASSNRIRLRNLSDSGDERAVKASEIIERFDDTLTAILIGNNIMHIGCASVAAVLVTRLWGAGAVKYSTFVVAAIIFLISEMIPKSYAKSRPEEYAMKVAASVAVFMKLMTPVTAFFKFLNKAFLKLFKPTAEPTITEDELTEIVEDIAESGGISGDKGELIQSALEFDGINVQEIFVPRSGIAAIDADLPASVILEIIMSKKYSRYPVYRGSLDNIIGILSIRKYLKAYLAGSEAAPIESLLDEALFVNRKMVIDDLLREISSRKSHMAVVRDEKGRTLGILTAEDILEELVGEIWDEDDAAAIEHSESKHTAGVSASDSGSDSDSGSGSASSSGNRDSASGNKLRRPDNGR